MDPVRRHYLDHNASTPVDPRVLEAFLEAEADCPANPGSLHAAGRHARARLEAARREVADTLGMSADGVLFVASGTEANNLVVRGSGDPAAGVLCAPLEHAAVLAPARARGQVSWRVDEQSRAVVERPAAAAGPVGLVCLAHAQSETGAVQDLAAAADVAAALGVRFHVDAAQTPGRLPLGEVLRLADSVAFSAHKCGGLRGGSVLVLRDPARAPRPLLLGGGQERGLRAGTPSVALAVATARALRLAVEEQPARAAAMEAARDAFAAELAAGVPDVGWRSPSRDALPNTCTVELPAPIDGRTLLPALDLAGLEASQGSACSSGAVEPPEVFRAMGLAAEAARRCVRFSFGAGQSASDGRDAGRRAAAVVQRLLRARPPDLGPGRQGRQSVERRGD